jgi:ankyrin repeat protein
MRDACMMGQVDKIKKLLDTGESVNGTDSAGLTIVMLSLYTGQIPAVNTLVARGADVSKTDHKGCNALLYSSMGGNLQSLDWVLANTSMKVDSTSNYGVTSLHGALINNKLAAAKYLVEKGANLFQRDGENRRALDIRFRGDRNNEAMGPQVLQYALELRWSSIKDLLLVANSLSSLSESGRSVFSNSDLVRHISAFMLRKELIVKDPAIPQIDDVRMRIEATLAGLAL